MKARQARPNLETLEGRLTPSGLNNWLNLSGDGLWATDYNWSKGHVPTSGEVAAFDDDYSNSPCYYDGGGGAIAMGIKILPGYTSTLSLTSTAAIDLYSLEQNDGNIEQGTADSDLAVDLWEWVGGNLNANSAFLADITVKPNGAATITGDDNTDGTNIKLGANSQMTISLNAGKAITFAKNAGIDIAAGARFEHNRDDFSTGGTGQIKNAGKYYKLTPNWVRSDLPFENTAATSEFHLGDLMSFGRLGGAGVSFLQQDGLIELAQGAELRVVNGLTMNNGKLWVLGQTGSSITTGNVIVHGGLIQLSQDDATKTGLLTVGANITLGAGTA